VASVRLSGGDTFTILRPKLHKTHIFRGCPPLPHTSHGPTETWYCFTELNRVELWRHNTQARSVGKFPLAQSGGVFVCQPRGGVFVITPWPLHGLLCDHRRRCTGQGVANIWKLISAWYSRVDKIPIIYDDRPKWYPFRDKFGIFRHFLGIVFVDPHHLSTILFRRG
jgi:hypothetical protein